MNKKLLVVGIVAIAVLIVVALSITYMNGGIVKPNNGSNEQYEHEDESEADYSEDIDFLNWALSDYGTLSVLADQVSYRFRYNDEPEAFVRHLINITTDRLDKYGEFALLSPEVQEIKKEGLFVMSSFQYVGFLALRDDSDFFDEMETARYHLKIWHDMICASEKTICD